MTSSCADSRNESSQKELSAALPHLRGVVPAQDLIRVWSGTFSTDVPGILRVLDRIPDTEALARSPNTARCTPSRAQPPPRSHRPVASELKGEQGAAYTALRTLASRIQRLSTMAAREVSEEDREGARDLSGELRVLAAFTRIREADRAGRADWAYLAVTDLTPAERDGLAASYLASWEGGYLTGARRRTLDAVVTTTMDDADRIIGTLERSSAEARAQGHEESTSGLEIAVTALGPALVQLAAKASDPKLTEAERQSAADRLISLASDDNSCIERLLALPGGEKLLRSGLGVSQRDRPTPVFWATSEAEVVEALRGLHGLDVSLGPARPDVQAHLAEQEVNITPGVIRLFGYGLLPLLLDTEVHRRLDITPGVMRVLTAYGQLGGAQAESLFWLPPGATLSPAAGPASAT